MVVSCLIGGIEAWPAKKRRDGAAPDPCVMDAVAVFFEAELGVGS